ncbi:hypothetical protein ACE1ET_00315 [Saccharicrinis sp. FJH62]|uniref:hypothetical protein n=1 Tax=Saccharicrinis sp. FJH62 TaxID=3344657 RepID=UPI0035D51E2E
MGIRCAHQPDIACQAGIAKAFSLWFNLQSCPTHRSKVLSLKSGLKDREHQNSTECRVADLVEVQPVGLEEILRPSTDGHFLLKKEDIL